MKRCCFYAFCFLFLCFSKSSVVSAVLPYGMVRLDFLDNPAPFDLQKKWNSYSLPGNAEGLIISTNLTSSIALNSAFVPELEKKFPQIPGDEIKDFVGKISSALRGENAKKCIQHLVFDNVPWEQISFKDFFLPLLKEIQNFKSLEFRQTVVEPKLLDDLLSHSATLGSLSFSSCFMCHDFLKKMEACPSKLKKLSLSQVGFLEAPLGNCPADSIPSGLTELSLSSCYRTEIYRCSFEGEGVVFFIKKIGHFVGVPWLAERKTRFPNLERLTIQEPEVFLENLASYPVDKVFGLAPRLNFFELSSCYHDEWCVEEEGRLGQLDQLDHLTSAQRFKKKPFSFLFGSPSIRWERGANSLTFEIDDALFFRKESGPKVLLAENNFFKLSEEFLDEKATKDFESLIEKFGKIDLIRLNKKDFFALKIKEYLKEKKIKVELMDAIQDPLPDYVVVACSRRVQMIFNVFDHNQKRGVAVYDSDLCKQLALKHNLPEQELKKKFEDGTVNELLKRDFQNVEDLAQYLIKKLNLFLFTAEELKKAQERLGYYPVSSLVRPYYTYFGDLKAYLHNPEIPIEFIELFSSDFGNLPDFTNFTKDYLIKREDHARKILGYPPKEIPPFLLHHLAIAYLFPSPCQLIPLLKVQERAERVARAILGLEEFEGECLEN